MKSNHTCYNHTRKGYTLMELVVVIMILGIVGSLTVRLTIATMGIYETVLVRSELINAGRQFAARFYRETKPIPFPDSLLVADSKSLQWKMVSGKIYTYTITGSEITRQVNSGLTQMLVNDVDYPNSNFTYYDSTGTELTGFPLSNTNRKKVRLIGATIRFSRGDESFVSNQRLYLANMRRY